MNEKADTHTPSPRRIIGTVWLAAIVALARIRSLGRQRRTQRDSERRRVAASEIIVAYPRQSWPEERNAAVEAALDLVFRRMTRWNVAIRGSRSVDRSRLHGLSRTYIRIGVDEGAEDDVVRAVRAATWRHGLRRGRFGVLVVRSPVIVPATGTGGPGPITFTDAYRRAKETIGVTDVNADATGVTILVVDVDRPDMRFLTDIADRVEILDEDRGPITDGHATLMTAVVGDIAQGATIKTLSIGDDGEASAWGLLGALLRDHDAHVIVASVSAPEGTKRKDSRGRLAVFASTLQSRMDQPSRPPLFCPTGNHDPNSTEKIDSLALPARFDSVIAIGAIDNRFARAAGSRYGEKFAGDPDAWWVAPGGSFSGSEISEPLAMMNNQPQAGTSIANAIAAALAAVTIRRLRDLSPAPDPKFEQAMHQLKDSLAKRPRPSACLELADALREQHTSAVTFAALVTELDEMARTDQIASYDVWEYGRGLLRLG